MLIASFGAVGVGPRGDAVGQVLLGSRVREHGVRGSREARYPRGDDGVSRGDIRAGGEGVVAVMSPEVASRGWLRTLITGIAVSIDILST